MGLPSTESCNTTPGLNTRQITATRTAVPARMPPTKKRLTPEEPALSTRYISDGALRTQSIATAAANLFGAASRAFFELADADAFVRARPAQDAAHRDVPLVARVLVEALIDLLERNHRRPGFCPHRGIVDREGVLHRVADAREAL